jgi:hypothetical protein
MTTSHKGLFAWRDSRLVRLAMVAMLAVLAVAAAWLLSGPSFQLRDVATRIERPLSRLLGFEVSVRGPVTVRPSLRPWVTLRDVHMRNPGADSNEEALVSRVVRVRLEAWPLLTGRWSIARLNLADTRLCVSLEPGSACDWRRALEAIGRVVRVDHLTVRHLSVRCIGGVCGRGLEERIGAIDAQLPANRDMQMSVYRPEEDDALARVSGGSWSVFRANRRWPVHGWLRSGAGRFEFAGVIARPRELSGVQFGFDGRADLGRWHQVTLGELRMRGRFAETNAGYRLVVEDGKWGTGTVNAELNAARTGHEVEIVGALAARHLDLDPWIDAPTQGEGAGGFADVDARFTTSGDSVEQWREHLRGSAQVAAGPAELPIEQVERWSRGFLKFVFALPEQGAATYVNCMGGDFDLRGDHAITHNARLDTTITRMRAVGSLSLRSGEMDFLVKPHLKKGPLKDAPLVAVTGKIEQPVSRLASSDESAGVQARFARLPVEPRDANHPCR